MTFTTQQGSDACLSKLAEARVTAVQSYNEEEKQRCNEPKISEGRHEQGCPSGTPANTPAGGPDRVAGGAAMSKKTSTAALESIFKGPLTTRRRAPRTPYGGKLSTQTW